MSALAKNTQLVKANDESIQSFVVMKMAENYNDEIYTLEDSGTPVKIFADKTEADAECRTLQRNELRGCQIGAYAYDMQELIGYSDEDYNRNNLSEQEVIDLLPFCNFSEGDFNEWMIPKNLTDQQLDKVCEVFNGLRFYTVVAVVKF